MKRILIVVSLIAIAAYSVIFFTVPVAKANATVRAYLPMIMRTGAITQSSTPTTIPIQPTLTPVQASPTPVRATPVPGDLTTMRAQVIAAVNVERQKAGCALVTGNIELDNGTQAWSDYLVAHNTYTHSDSIDVDWYLKHGYTRSDWVSENVAAGPRTGADVVAVWMSDEGHKATILVGCAETNHTFDAGVGFTNYRWVLAIGELHT